MNKTQVISILKENRNERGVANWKKVQAKTTRLKSFGIGLTLLRKIAKQVGRDHQLALKLWESDIYDAKVIGLLIDDPKQLTRGQAEEQVEELDAGMFAHVFASCNATLAKTPFAPELANDWMKNKDKTRRRCGYTLLYELSKRNIKSMDDAYYMDRIAHIQNKIDGELTPIRGAMGGALIGIGKRNKKLNKAAVRAAKVIGPIEYGSDHDCEPLDLIKHLTSDYLKNKFSAKR